MLHVSMFFIIIFHLLLKQVSVSYIIIYHLLLFVFHVAENLLLTQEVREISHSEVGKFFEEFQGRFYIPNDDKLKEYPDDLAETEAQINRFFEENQQE